jgi:hypothetical protein
MTTSFDSLIASPPSGRAAALLLDHSRYGSRRLLLGGPVPWTDPVSCSAFFGQAQGLLRPDTTLVDVGEAYSQHLAARPDLTTAMGVRARTGYALKTLLADPDLAGAVHALVTVLSQTSRQPLVLEVPSPLRWLAAAQLAAGGHDLSGIEPEHGEAASMYMSDWLRRFGSLPVALLLLDARRGHDPDLKTLPDDVLAAYTPLLNAAGHYRWALGLRTDQHVEVSGTTPAGVVVQETYWNDDTPAPPGAFRLADIPADIEPEQVLARLADLR